MLNASSKNATTQLLFTRSKSIKNTRKKCELFSKSTLKTPELGHQGGAFLRKQLLSAADYFHKELHLTDAVLVFLLTTGNILISFW